MISPELDAKLIALNTFKTSTPRVAMEFPHRLESTANGSQGVSIKGRKWRAKKRSGLRETTALVCAGPIRRSGVKPPVAVRIVRVAPNRLDDDNAQFAGKPIRDVVAALLGVNDKDISKFVAEVDQERRGVREYAVKVEIYERR